MIDIVKVELLALSNIFLAKTKKIGVSPGVEMTGDCSPSPPSPPL